MSSKFFDREIDPACRYCAVGTPNVDKDFVLCPKRGVMAASDHCAAFRYDPLRREIRRAPKMPADDYRPEDFTL